MKELDVFRYLKKYRAVIAGVSIFAGIAFFFWLRSSISSSIRQPP